MNVSHPERHKIALLGPSSAGKTSIMIRFSNSTFSEDEEPTVGAAFASKDLTVSGKIITLNIWDTAGQERFKSLVPKYARGASAIIVVFDVTKPESYTQARNLVETERTEYGDDVCWFFVGNKIDCSIEVDLSSAAEFARSQNIKFFRTSAKTGDNVDTLFQCVAEEVEMRSHPDRKVIPMEPQKNDENKCC